MIKVKYPDARDESLILKSHTQQVEELVKEELDDVENE